MRTETLSVHGYTDERALCDRGKGKPVPKVHMLMCDGTGELNGFLLSPKEARLVYKAIKFALKSIKNGENSHDDIEVKISA